MHTAIIDSFLLSSFAHVLILCHPVGCEETRLVIAIPLPRKRVGIA